MEKQEHYLTTKEAAAQLNVSVPTIYKYVKEKKLSPVYQDKWQIDETLLFQPSEIEQLKERFKKPGLTTGEVANALGVHPTTIASYIKQGYLKAEKHFYKGRELYFIDEEELEIFKENNEFHKIKEKKLFYSKKKDLYLFQTLAKKTYPDKIARIMTLHDNEGKVVTEDGHVFPLSSIETEGYFPKERFRDRNYITKRGYATFEFDKPNRITSPVYDLIELFYREVGYKNMRLTESDETIQIEIKPALIKGISVENQPYQIELINDKIKDGTISIRHNGLLVDSDIDSIIIHVPSQLKTDIKSTAVSKGKSLEEYILSILKEHIKLNS